MRRRSFHSSCTVNSSRDAQTLSRTTKGNILELRRLDTKVLENNVSVYANIVRPTDSLITLVRKELQLYKNKKNTYNGVINLLNKPHFLRACFEEIYGKSAQRTLSQV